MQLRPQYFLFQSCDTSTLEPPLRCEPRLTPQSNPVTELFWAISKRLSNIKQLYLYQREDKGIFPQPFIFKHLPRAQALINIMKRRINPCILRFLFMSLASNVMHQNILNNSFPTLTRRKSRKTRFDSLTQYANDPLRHILCM